MDAKVEILKKHCFKLEKLTDLLSAFTALEAMEEYATFKVNEYKNQQQSAVIPETNESGDNLADYDKNHVEQYISNH